MNCWYVDDDSDMIHAMSMMLSLLRIHVRPFLTVRAAVRALQTGDRPELLLLDINMPEVNGMDLLEFIRRNGEFDDLPILMLSSEHTDVQVQEALMQGADGYAMKPVTVDELKNAIQSAVETRHTRASLA